jgi:hypothetical protein
MAAQTDKRFEKVGLPENFMFWDITPCSSSKITDASEENVV